MSDQLAYLQSLYRWGHFWRADTPSCHNVRWQDLPKLAKDDKHRLVKHATRVFQESDQNFEYFAMQEHHRPLIPDGEAGPATALMAAMPRCGIPDRPPPPGVSDQWSKVYGDGDLDLAIESMVAFATGRGSWPVPGCDPERPNRESEHSVRVNVMTSGASSHQKAVLRQVLDRVEECEAEIGQHVRHIIDGDPSQAEHDVRFQNIPGGTIGFAYFPTPDTCNQTVRARIDNTYNADVTMLASLFIHEYKGHSDGLQHTRGGIMNPSILRTRLSWIGDPHESTKTRYFGGEPIDDDPSGPEPQPPSGHNGVFVYKPKTDWPAGEPRTLKIKVDEL